LIVLTIKTVTGPTGTTVVAQKINYYYDAFGTPVESTSSVNNSFLYAGYQYDQETGMYYLNARMYDPTTARFMQEDSYTGNINDPLSLNLYTYCNNSPLIYDDPTGHWPHILVGAIIGAVAGVAMNAVSDYLDDGKFNSKWQTYVGAGVGGAITGAIAAATFGGSLLTQALAVGAGTFAGSVANQYISKGEVDWKQAALEGVIGGGCIVGGQYVGKFIEKTGITEVFVSKAEILLNASKVRIAALGDSAMSRLTDRIGSVKLAFADGDGGIFNKVSFKGTINDSNIGESSVQRNYNTVMNETIKSKLIGALYSK